VPDELISTHENTFLQSESETTKWTKLKSYKGRRGACWHKVTSTLDLDFLALKG